MRSLLLLLALLTASCASAPPMAVESPSVIYVGNGANDADEPLRAYAVDLDSGVLTALYERPGLLGPNYIAIAPDGRSLYTVSGNPDGGQGLVSAFARDPETQALTLLNQHPTMGTGPCYVAISPDGQWVVVANYSSGNVALYPVATDGALEAASDVQQHDGSSIDTDRQNGPHAHYIDFDPSGRFVLANDLGTDETRVYALDTDAGRLAPVFTAEATPGHGPRHLAFSPDGDRVYVLGELVGTVTAYRFADDGTLSAFQTVSLMPEGFDGYNKSADIHIHPSGRFLYASNRGDYDSIAAFAIAEDGILSPLGHTTEGVVWPRNFAIDPSGQLMLVANRRANTLTSYRIDQATGALTLLSTTEGLAEPVVVKFAP